MLDQKTAVYQLLGAFAGIASPILAIICVFSAIATYPRFSWTDNALSDLGLVSGLTGVVFNFGLYTSGILGLKFSAFGLFTWFKSWTGKLGALFFGASSLALVGIGFFNESFSPTHYIVSVAFFALAPISLLILTVAFWNSKHRKMAVLTFSTSVIAILPWLLMFTLRYAPNVAIPEIISGISFAVWVVAVAWKILEP